MKIHNAVYINSDNWNVERSVLDPPSFEQYLQKVVKIIRMKTAASSVIQFFLFNICSLLVMKPWMDFQILLYICH